MMSSIARWPPVSGHPAMEVAIEVQFRRARQRGTGWISVRCARLFLRRGLVFLVSFVASLSVAFIVWGRGRSRGSSWGRVGIKTIGHGVGVRVVPKARGGGKNC